MSQDAFPDFLDDYFAECDEHLTLVRRGLLTLETFISQPRLDRALLDELFRSFHSLKGISAMVGVREAEQLAHDMESYLRGLRDEQLALTMQGLDELIAGTVPLGGLSIGTATVLSRILTFVWPRPLMELMRIPLPNVLLM